MAWLRFATFPARFRKYFSTSRGLRHLIRAKPFIPGRVTAFSVYTHISPIILLSFIWPFTKSRDDQPESVDDVTRRLFVESYQAILSQNFSVANFTLHELLKHLKMSFDQGSLDTHKYIGQRARVCSELANVNLLMGNVDQAESLVKQTIRDCTVVGVAPDDAMIVELSLKLALIYQQMKRNEEADLGFAFCIRSQQDKLATDVEVEQLTNEQALLGMCHNYYSKFLFTTGRTELALSHAQKALKLANQIYEESHLNCLHLHCDIAVILIDLNRFGEARSLLTKAVLLARAQLLLPDQESEHPQLRECLTHLLLQQVALESMDGNQAAAICRFKEVQQAVRLLTDAKKFLPKLEEYRSLYNVDT